jgi:hypothetical protein
VEFLPRFGGKLPHKFAVIEFGLITLLHFPTSSNIMPLDATQLTIFWTDNNQMGLSARICAKMETEGLMLPEDFADFAKKEDLNALYRTLLKPTKTTVGASVNAGLREVSQYKIPTRLQIRLHVAQKMMAYYTIVGRLVEADDLLWPVIKSFSEQWKALLEKKAADAGVPPKLDKNKLVHRWMEQAEQYRLRRLGYEMCPSPTW